ncbi:hypothetical protein FGO68_gene1798 [Halteria grandinella]|uniref:HIT domain-containing protein n=1 Tax=Halteria grandinella TaxID=5974 RepID=A0A8J8NIT0_HALGN|nr:hypothetical protein FGO68_gene1798 [Halteria grandinella]
MVERKSQHSQNSEYSYQLPPSLELGDAKLPINKDCIFCEMLISKGNMVYEDDLVYVFKDIDPDAQYHYQMIPKWHIKNLAQLNSENALHRHLVSHFYDKGFSLVKMLHPDLINSDIAQIKDADADLLRIGFHRPKCTSIDHLHMHMMVGKRKWKASWQFCWLFYRSISDVKSELVDKAKVAKL